MELVLLALAVFVITFSLFMIGFLVSRQRAKKEVVTFQRYLAQQFPELPVPAELLLASQQSKGKADSALVVADARREIVVLFDRGAEGITHLTYPFSALRRVDSSNQIISRGLPPSRVFSYQQTMTVTFADGRSIPFVLEFPSNKHGTDNAPRLVAELFAPWEAKLHAILRETSGASAPSPAEHPAPTPTPPASPVATVPPAPPPRPSTPPPVAPAAWRADPYRRFDWRSFDGNQWTDQVSTGGQVRSDPPARVAPPEPAHH